ncbi:MAG: hypothetical protein J5997_13420 [Oscillospiraceae bacterium]|nr:hypothetical protein [Oscillospiraceae bacterium]
MKKFIAVLTGLSLSCMLFAGCGGGGDYEKYASAYKKVSAQGGMEANIDLSLKMDGVTTETDGLFKLDTSNGKNILYYEMDVDGNKIIQFSDGDYIYTEADGHKTRYAMNSKPAMSSDREEAQKKGSDTDSTFNTEEFLNEFSSFLEAGKIKELGLLSPIERAAITDISASGDVYTLSFSDTLVKKYLNIIIANETQSTDGDTLVIDELNNFSNKVTVTNDIVTKAQYSGTMKVTVPASLMASGTETSYDLDLVIDISFVDPGSAVDITLPSTDGYETLN